MASEPKGGYSSSYVPSTKRAHRYRAKRIIDLQGLKIICDLCGKTYSIEVHHINGIYTDHRVENLQLLCKSCHMLVHGHNTPTEGWD